MSISGRQSSKKNTFCIQYWKMGDAANPKVMRRINANGVVVSAKTYSEVFFYGTLKESLGRCSLVPRQRATISRSPNATRDETILFG